MATSGKNAMRADVGSAIAYGEGGTVTQGTSRTTAVTLNKRGGQITLFTAAGSSTPASFTVNNTLVDSDSFVKVCVSSSNASNVYNAWVSGVADGSFTVTFYAVSGTTSDAPVFSFMVWQNDIT